MKTISISALPIPVRILMVRPRLLGSALCGAFMAAAAQQFMGSQVLTSLIIGWNVGAICYLVLSARMMFWSSHERMRKRAILYDEGRIVILTFVVLAAVVSLGAIVGELAVSKDIHGISRYAHIGLAALTLLTSWAFTQMMFAQHYAHDYYASEAKGCDGGLEFPGKHAPDYGDFIYFACVIGTSGQTADVSFTTRSMRRTGAVHCVLAFFFNTTLLALTINIASGLL